MKSEKRKPFKPEGLIHRISDCKCNCLFYQRKEQLMILTRNFVQLIAIAVLLGTITFFIKKYWDFDFRPYGFGVLMGFIAYLLIKRRKK